MSFTMRRVGRFWGGAATLLICCSLPVSAQVIVHDNFGVGNAFQAGVGAVEAGTTSFFGTDSEGYTFTPTASGTLYDITVAISRTGSFGSNDAHVYLADATGGVPGTTLEAFTLTNLPGFGTTFTPQTLTSTLHPFLTAGTTYFLFEQETGSEANVWNANSIGEGGTLESFDNLHYAANNATAGAYQVRVTPATTPGPSSLAVLAGGFSSVGVLLRRRRRSA